MSTPTEFTSKVRVLHGLCFCQGALALLLVLTACGSRERPLPDLAHRPTLPRAHAETADQATARMARLGFTPCGPFEVEPAVYKEVSVSGVQTMAGTCYFFAALGAAGVEALELELKRGSALIVADNMQRPAAWIAYCADRLERLRLVTRVRSGAGEVTHACFTALRERGQALLGPPVFVAFDAKEITMDAAAIDRRLIQRGFLAGMLLKEGALCAGERLSIELILPAGACAAVSSLAGGNISDLDLELVGTTGSPLAADNSVGREAVIYACAPIDNAAAHYNAKVVALDGCGPVRLSQHLAPHPVLPTALLGGARLSASLAAGLLARHARHDVPMLLTLALAHDGTFRAPLPLRADTCFGVAVFGTGELEHVAIQDQTEKLIASWQGPEALAVLTLCNFEQTEAEISARAFERSAAPLYAMVYEFLAPFGISPDLRDMDGPQR